MRTFLRGGTFKPSYSFLIGGPLKPLWDNVILGAGAALCSPGPGWGGGGYYYGILGGGFDNWLTLS